MLGSGEVGRRLAAGFSGRGHQVMIGTRDPGQTGAARVVDRRGSRVETGTFAEAARYGELLVLALLGSAAEDVIAEAGPVNFSSKVVIDAMNPLDFSAGFRPSFWAG